jgi:RNA polymerase sigma factor (TIGR02999 family)
MSNATQLLYDVEQGSPTAAGELLDLVYDELRRLAAYKMTQQAPGQTLQPTALVHEAWLRLAGGGKPHFEHRAHFFRAAAEAMRHILIDRARRRQTERHGGSYVRVELDESLLANLEDDDHLLVLNEALGRLETLHPAKAQVVKLRYFAGMTQEEISETLGVSVSTVKNYWVFSRAWLFNEMTAK